MASFASRAARHLGPVGRGEDGAAAVLLLILTPALFGLAGLVFDGGRQLAARQQAADLAEQAARAGADRLSIDALRTDPQGAAGSGVATLDTPAATGAACRYVASVEPGATCKAAVVPSASGPRVHVEVSASRPTVLLGLVGVNRLHVRSTADATAVTGIRTVLGQG